MNSDKKSGNGVNQKTNSKKHVISYEEKLANECSAIGCNNIDEFTSMISDFIDIIQYEHIFIDKYCADIIEIEIIHILCILFGSDIILKQSPLLITKCHNIVNLMLIFSSPYSPYNIIPRHITHITPFQHILTRIKQYDNITQRSTEWLTNRALSVNASEIGDKLFSGPITFSKYAEEKARAIISINRSKSTDDGITTPTRFISATTDWGNKFEPIALAIFSQQYNVNIITASSIPHPYIPKLAASPDGIIIDGIYRGQLIEIKCVVSRKLIENYIPFEYWCQMQTQMACTQTTRAHFWECQFEDFTNIHNLFHRFHHHIPTFCGIIAKFIQNTDNNTNILWEFHIINTSSITTQSDFISHLDDFIANMCEKHGENVSCIDIRFWTLTQTNHQIVDANCEFIANLQTHLDDFWLLVNHKIDIIESTTNPDNSSYHILSTPKTTPKMKIQIEDLT